MGPFLYPCACSPQLEAFHFHFLYSRASGMSGTFAGDESNHHQFSVRVHPVMLIDSLDGRPLERS